MDLCHCVEPAPEKVNGSLVCLNCRLYYDERAWSSDPRTKRKSASRQFNAEQERIINNIVAHAKKLTETNL